MREPLSPELLQRLRERQAAPAPKRPLPWLQIVTLLIAAGVIGWAVFKHYKYRVPQEHDLSFANGRTEHVNILAGNDHYLQVQAAGATQISYLPISSLTPADQAYAAHLNTGLVIQFPVVYTLSLGDESLPVQLEARDHDWLKASLLTGNTTTYLPIAKLSDADRDFVDQMPSTLVFNYPVEYTLTGPPQTGVSIKILGRSTNYAAYQGPVDASPANYIKLAALNERDQAFFLHLPNSLPASYPADYPLHSATGQALSGLITGHNRDVVAVQPPQGPVHYFPIAMLDSDGRQFLTELPGVLNFACPADCTITDYQGNPRDIHVLARGPQFIQYSSLDGGTVQYLALADLSPADQALFGLLPVTLNLRYPFDYSITDQSGRTLPVNLKGRSTTEVQFALANGTTTSYPLAKLSQENQDFLRLLPVSPYDLNATASAPKEPPEVLALRDEIARLQDADDKLRTQLDNPILPQGQKETAAKTIDNNEITIAVDQSKIANLLQKAGIKK